MVCNLEFTDYLNIIIHNYYSQRYFFYSSRSIVLGAFPKQTNPKSLENEVLKIQQQNIFSDIFRSISSSILSCSKNTLR